MFMDAVDELREHDVDLVRRVGCRDAVFERVGDELAAHLRDVAERNVGYRIGCDVHDRRLDHDRRGVAIEEDLIDPVVRFEFFVFLHSQSSSFLFTERRSSLSFSARIRLFN